MAQQPSKRRRTDLTYTVHDLDIEINLRQRFIHNIESRIRWATLLQESLASGNDTLEHLGTESFQTIATDAYSATSESTRHILAPPPIPRAVIPRTRPTIDNRLQNTAPERKFIYIKSSSLSFDHHPPTGTSNEDAGKERVFILACPTCKRSNFTNLQGLYNHGRLTHNISWGSHEECVKACIVLVDASVNLLEGHEIVPSAGGFRPDIQGLFKRAVETEETSLKDGSLVGITSSVGPVGLHADSPSLAPFLGRQMKPRQIRVFDTGYVDIVSPPIGQASSNGPLPREHRRQRGQCFTNMTSYDSEAVTPFPPLGPPQLGLTPGANGPLNDHSRFHLVSRILLVDRSLWVKEDHAYKWMISVDSPSYSRHITTILQSMSVTSVSGSPSFTSRSDTPPYVVVGRASVPFLARIELFFNGIQGSSEPQRQVFEHWVDLDVSCSGVVTVGEEQVVDVELDKHTTISPPHTQYTPISSRSLWNNDTAKSVHGTEVAGYEKELEELVAQFPLTKEDAKARGSRKQVPYRLMQSMAELQNCTIGRRKAIEWGRARAIQVAYSERLGRLKSPDELVLLSTGDVFVWLEENGHFLRGPPSEPKSPLRPSTPAASGTQTLRWCGFCGILIDLHPPLKTESSSGTTDHSNEWHCVLQTILHQPEPSDVSLDPTLTRQGGSFPFSPRDWLASSDPALIFSVRRQCTVVETGQDEESLAPYGLVALLLRPLIKVLVEKGLEISTRDARAVERLLATPPQDLGKRILTPKHILRGVFHCDTVPLKKLIRKRIDYSTEQNPPVKQEEMSY